MRSIVASLSQRSMGDPTAYADPLMAFGRAVDRPTGEAHPCTCSNENDVTSAGVPCSG